MDRMPDDDRAALFLESACWDHHTHGTGDHRMHDRAAQRHLAQHPEIARHDLYCAIQQQRRDIEGAINRRLVREAGVTEVEQGRPAAGTSALTRRLGAFVEDPPDFRQLAADDLDADVQGLRRDDRSRRAAQSGLM